MTSFTKQAIVRSFLELLDEEPFDRITVTQIAQRCGISRNTFYYHYQDIFSLVDDMFTLETRRVLDRHGSFDDWGEALDVATTFARTNRRAIYHLYNSSNRERLEHYLNDVFYGIIRRFVDTISTDLDVRERDAEDLTRFYAAAFEGVTLAWIRDGMADDNASVANTVRMLEGTIRYALERSVSNR